MSDSSDLAAFLQQSWAKHGCSVGILALCFEHMSMDRYLTSVWTVDCISLIYFFEQIIIDSVQQKQAMLRSVLHSCADRQRELKKLLPSLMSCWQNSLSRRTCVTQQQWKSNWVLCQKVSVLLYSCHICDLMASYSIRSWWWCWFPFCDTFWLEILSKFQISIEYVRKQDKTVASEAVNFQKIDWVERPRVEQNL